MQDQRAEVEWRDGLIPVSSRFDDPYFSLENGLSETRHVFLAGNGLPGRFADGFHVAELGFGTGLNMLATWAVWDQAALGGPLRFTSFEAFPMSVSDMGRALQSFSELEPWRDRFLAAWRGPGVYELDTLSLEVIAGDARTQLPAWQGVADAWFLDGFSPAKNPELWGADLMSDVGRHSRQGGTMATYTAAGFVRRGLENAGFDVTRAPGFGRKRHMTRGIKA